MAEIVLFVLSVQAYVYLNLPSSVLAVYVFVVLTVVVVLVFTL